MPNAIPPTAEEPIQAYVLPKHITLIVVICLGVIFFLDYVSLIHLSANVAPLLILAGFVVPMLFRRRCDIRTNGSSLMMQFVRSGRVVPITVDMGGWRSTSGHKYVLRVRDLQGGRQYDLCLRRLRDYLSLVSFAMLSNPDVRSTLEKLRLNEQTSLEDIQNLSNMNIWGSIFPAMFKKIWKKKDE